MSKYTFNTMTGQVERKDEPAAGDVTEMTPEKLREFIENGCSARPEDKHDALVGVSAWEADLRDQDILKAHHDLHHKDDDLSRARIEARPVKGEAHD